MERVRKYTYPAARRDETVDDYHGTLVPDPYRWMEDPDSPELLAWIDAENELSGSFLAGVSQRAALKQRLEALWNFPKVLVPERKGDRYFYQKNDGLQNQPVLYLLRDLKGEPEVVLDPNTFSDDGTVAMMGTEFTRDGKLLAYMISVGGSDWMTVHVRDIDAGADLPDVIEWVKFPGIAWKPDKSGFFYNRHELDGEVPATEPPYFRQVYFHKLGTPQSEDVLIFDGSKEAGDSISATPSATHDGAYVLLDLFESFDHNRIFIRPMDGDEPFRPLIEESEGEFLYVGSRGSELYFQTSLDAPRRRVIAVDANHPARENWREVIPEQPDPIAAMELTPLSFMANDQFVVVYMHDASHRIRIFNLDGTLDREIDLPALGSIRAASGEADHDEMFFTFESFLYPTSVYRHDFKAGKTETFFAPEIDFDPTAYVTTQVFATSKDGTRVPMFLNHKKGITLDGSSPTILYGYGGFLINMIPIFSVFGLVWMELGGVFAQVNLRGGLEYGEDWHKAGMLGNKQNVFDDFIAAAEHLIESGCTRRDKLAIYGGSNGGLLVSACMVQRPDLFGAVISRVPVTDMLRYQHFTAGRYWTTEYGDAEQDPEAFKYLYKYSPLHNVREGETYPPILTVAAMGDDRVVPMHAAKFTAALQAADSGENPLLLVMETKAGHGAGKPTNKLIEMFADILAFLVRTLSIND